MINSSDLKFLDSNIASSSFGIQDSGFVKIGYGMNCLALD
jgi:hypothetical protein